ncbi:hypothetical protein [Thermogemmatispora sp.]|uniref:hypothetical protein n=1 Tax=Thermogemmatispora sp. TaxID=1968838 RepID=UPI001D6EE6EA|nr:hypothetical protein [Thermogemmatispora sp.]MBX5449480.1 hypothetical protein [Thermogemmatispora sp.]
MGTASPLDVGLQQSSWNGWDDLGAPAIVIDLLQGHRRSDAPASALLALDASQVRGKDHQGGSPDRYLPASCMRGFLLPFSLLTHAQRERPFEHLARSSRPPALPRAQAR